MVKVIDINNPGDYEQYCNDDLYGYTLKINGKREPMFEDYIPLMAKLSQKVEVLCNVFEDKTKRGETTRLHVHGLFKHPRNPYLKPILGPGVHIDLERIYDKEGWLRYVNKNSGEGPRYPDPLF